MAKIFRAMKRNAATGMPVAGAKIEDTGSCCLGVRNGDIAPDSNQIVKPGVHKGLSVYRSAANLKPTMVSQEYEGTHGIEGAAGGKSYRVWTHGSGRFSDAPVAKSLQLAVDNASHGIIEPDVEMHKDEYQAAIADTAPSWIHVDPK